MQVDRSKSKGSYEYKEEMETLFENLARKYKRGNGELIEGVEVRLQRDPKSETHLLLVRLKATNNNIFTGLVIPDISEIRSINDKEENVEVMVFVTHKDRPTERVKIKLQVNSPIFSSNPVNWAGSSVSRWRQ